MRRAVGGHGILGVITPTVRVSSVAGRRRNRGRRRRRGPARPLAEAAAAVLGRGPGDPPGQSRVHAPPRSPTLLDRLRPTHVSLDGDGRRGSRPVPTASRRRPAAAAIVVTSGHRGRAQGRRADPRRHGGDGPRLLRRPRRRAGRPLARVPAAASRREPRRARPLVRHRRAVHRARRLRPRTRRRDRRASEGDDDRVARPDHDAAPARRRRAAARVPRGDHRRRAVPDRRCGRAPRPTGVARRRRVRALARRGAASRSTASPIDGVEVQLAADGEILVRGAMVMRGYRLDPERTRGRRSTPTAGSTPATSARSTATVASRVVDRLKDLVITGGVNVSPTEVEGVLAHHPDVDDVCVVGVPDDEWGELVVAFVVAPRRCAGRRRSTSSARSGATGSAAPKLPREARAVDAIPRTASGKAACAACYGRRRRHVIEPTKLQHVRVGAPANSGAVDSSSQARISERGTPALDRRDAVADRELVVDELRRASCRSGPRTSRRRPARSRPASPGAGRRPAGCAAAAGSASRHSPTHAPNPSTSRISMK